MAPSTRLAAADPRCLRDRSANERRRSRIAASADRSERTGRASSAVKRNQHDVNPTCTAVPEANAPFGDKESRKEGKQDQIDSDPSSSVVLFTNFRGAVERT